MDIGQLPNLSVLAPGAGCEIDVHDSKPIPGVISAVCVYAGPRVQYQVVWWAGRDRKEAWLEGSEIKPASPEKPRLGFHLTPES